MRKTGTVTMEECTNLLATLGAIKAPSFGRLRFPGEDCGRAARSEKPPETGAVSPILEAVAQGQDRGRSRWSCCSQKTLWKS